MSLVALTLSRLKRTWEQGDPAAIDDWFAPDAEISGLEEMDVIGPRDFAVFHRMVLRQFRDIRINMIHGVEQDAWAALSFELCARDILNRRDLRTIGHVMVHIQDGRVVRAFNFIDFLSLLEQIGRMPPRTRDRAMLGERLQFVPDPHRTAN